MSTRLTRPAHSRTVLRHVAVVVLAVVVLATACSDAHSQTQRDWVDTGLDPNVLTLLAPPELTPVLTALGHAFLSVRPNTAVVFVDQINDSSGRYQRVKSKLTNTQLIQAGAAPSLWIDHSSLLKPFLEDPRVQGRVAAFAVNPAVMVVPVGNPAHLTGLDAFAAGGPTAAHCTPKVLCGALATVWLAKAHIKPSWSLQLPTGAAVALAVGQGRVQVGLASGLDLTPGDPTVTTVTVSAPPAPGLAYHMLSMSPNPTAAQFERWLETSPYARSVEASYGLLPGNGKAAT